MHSQSPLAPGRRAAARQRELGPRLIPTLVPLSLGGSAQNIVLRGPDGRFVPSGVRTAGLSSYGRQPTSAPVGETNPSPQGQKSVF